MTAPACRLGLCGALLVAVAGPALASAPGERTADAFEALTECAGAVVRDDRGAVERALERALEAAQDSRALMDDAEIAAGLGRGMRTTRRKADRLRARTAYANALLVAEGISRLDLVRALERASREANKLLRRLAQRNVECPLVLVRPGNGAPFRSGGGRVRLRTIPADGGSLLGAVPRIAENVPDGARVLDSAVERTGSGRFQVHLGTEPGAVRIEAEACSRTVSIWIVVTGPKASLAGPLASLAAPASPRYANTAPAFRVGEAAELSAPRIDGAAPESYAVAPELPAGLTLDATSGGITGTPIAPLQPAEFVVTATNTAGSAQTTLSIQVTPALPEGVAELAPGFVVEPVLAGAAVPVKLAAAPDGRLFFNELMTGNVRVISPAGDLVGEPFYGVEILTGGERGLLGIALAPDFGTSGHVYLYASVPAADGHPDRNKVLRLTASGDVGTEPTVIVDDLPVGTLHNAGDLAFGTDGKLYVSVGDTGDSALSQQDGSRAGRILRFEPDGSVPLDNPLTGDPEWCRGLRNPFGLAVHAGTGGLFVTENGPTANDELLFAQPEKNFEWGPVPPDLPEFLRGFTLTSWTPVIVPTGITFVSTETFGTGFENDLFLCSYDHAEVRRIPLSGERLTDIDSEEPFLLFTEPEAIANKPLDVADGVDGALYVSTFSGIWRVRRWAADGE